MEDTTKLNKVQFWVPVILLGIGLLLHNSTVTPPADTKESPFVEYDRVWSDDEVRQLQEEIVRIGVFENTVDDLTSKYDHIGEAQPLIDGKCQHPLMTPNKARTRCTLAARTDIGKHYVMTGGRGAVKETKEKLISRMMSFSKFYVNDTEDLKKSLPGYSTLFETEKYSQTVKTVCGNASYLDPFQLGIIIQLPGQQVPTHIDAPWFFGADRLKFPIWLLVVMQRSGLFADKEVPQIQGVAYINTWGGNATGEQIAKDFGGNFFYYSRGPHHQPKSIPPKTNTAIMLNGAVHIHGTDMYLANRSHPAPPLLEKSIKYALRLNESSGLWDVKSGDDIVASYSIDDLRVSLVWRSKCFKDEAEFARYKSAPAMKLDDIVDTLTQDMVRRGVLSPHHNISRLDLALLMLKTYVNYPLPPAMVPYNPCALPLLSPFIDRWFSPIFNLFC